MDQMRRPPTQGTPLRTLPNVRPLCRTAQGSEAWRSPLRTDQMMALVNTANLNMEKMLNSQKDYQQEMDRKTDTCNKIDVAVNTILKRLDEMKATREFPSAIEQDNVVPGDDMFGDIPSSYRFSLGQLRELQSESTGPGNFSLSLTSVVWTGSAAIEVLLLWWGCSRKVGTRPRKKGCACQICSDILPYYQEDDHMEGFTDPQDQ